MKKKLEDMTLEELWQLFPIFLVPHKEDWTVWYQEESQNLLSLIPHDRVKRLSHIGSTAIPNIWAKNIVDILLEVDSLENLEKFKSILLEHGWLCMSQIARRISLNKGYTQSGFADRVFHLHLRIFGDNDELYFRDYLLDHPDIAIDYESLKLKLWRRYEYDRDGYTEEKADFIRKYTNLARKDYAGGY